MESSNRAHGASYLLAELRDENAELLESLALLREARDGFAELFELAPLPILVVAPHELVILRLNLATAELLRQPPKDIVGRTLLDYFHEEDRAQVRACMNEPCRGPKKCLARLLPGNGAHAVELRGVASERAPGMLHVAARPAS